MAWNVIYYAAEDGSVPAIEFLDGCPTSVAANLLAVLEAVADAPPPKYSGGEETSTFPTRQWTDTEGEPSGCVSGGTRIAVE